MIKVVSYNPEFRDSWNALNSVARNGHLLFDRGFMEYHSDRFTDSSYIFTEDDTAIALIPANVVDNTVYSHQGLTFGGFVTSDRVNSIRMLKIWDAFLDELRARGMERLIYKALPHIYHRSPAQEDLYGLFRHRALLVRRDVTTVVDSLTPGIRSKRRERGIKKAAKAMVSYAPSQSWEEFWHVLSETLAARHEVKPTHTIGEITTLAARFPEQIRLFTASYEGRIIAGVVMFETKTVAHAQYIAASTEGREVAALDGLFDFLINLYRRSHRYFDFGISNENGGWVLNEGLVTQKEEFGGSTVVHDVYEVSISKEALQ